ncbi:MAG: hypothetical protein HYR88_08015 [Verrucomicrobia bacterium]|nr:hypothetical protein [Verrucomicrobiota bacterium]
MRHITPFLLLALGLSPSLHGATFVNNPSFEKNYNPAFPGYSSINDWGGGSGVNQANGPFHNGGTPIPDQARVGFQQGSGSLSQTISGLTAGQLYWAQYFYDARNCCGGTIDIITKFADQSLDRVLNVKPSTGGQPYKFRNVPFTPQSDSGALVFTTAASGDATALFDGVSIVERDATDIVIMNPSFEASGDVADPGYVFNTDGSISQRIAGWASAGNVGINASGLGVFANNGVAPDQDHVAFIEGAGSLSQVVNNLAVGKEYTFSFSVNAPSGGAPHARVSIDDTTLLEGDVAAVGDAAYALKTAKFIAASPSVTLKLEQTVDGQVLLLDNVRLQGEIIVPLDCLSFSPNSMRLIGAGDDGTLPLTFAQKGSATASFSVLAINKGGARVDVTDAAKQCIQNDVSVNVVTSFIRNPSFEANAQPGGVGYSPIVAWQAEGNTGLNTGAGPFHDNGKIPDRAQVAFLQGSSKLRQTVYALEAGKTYWLQFAYNARNCCGGTIDMSINWNGAEVSKITGITAVGNGPYSLWQAEITPTSSSGVLEFATHATGDATALIDGVSLTLGSPDEIPIMNRSFEASGSPEGVGYIQPFQIGGWTAAGGYGVNVTGVGPFTDNGSGPEQDRVLFLQGASSVTQTIGGLNPGDVYTLMASVNSRNCCTAGPTKMAITVGADLSITDEDVAPIGGNKPYRRIRGVFTASDTTAVLKIAHTPPGGDHSLLVDQVRIFKGDVPLPVSLGGAVDGSGNVVVTWPAADTEGMTLQTGPTPDGPWTDDTAPVVVDGDSNTAVVDFGSAAKFYRLITK